MNISKSNKRAGQMALKKTTTDVDKELVEFEPKDDADCDTEAITKEEEIITKRKTELTTTRQIETRVKRQVVLEDGKVVEDSGPIVSTNTTEDTDKQETETTEKHDLGIPEDDLLKVTSGALKDEVDGKIAELNGSGGKLVKRMVPQPSDGLVREDNDKRIISHEEVKDYLETEDVHHLGDFSDETYVKAVHSGVENLEAVLLSPESQQQLVPLGPRIIANTTKSFKTIDSEDTVKRRLAQPDGKLVTEHKKTTEHEIIVDKPLPEKDDNSTGSREQVKTVEATQRYYKQRDEQNVDLIANGKVVGTEMRYAAETMQMEKDGSLERPGDWDSLSDRMRKQRRPHQKSLLQQQKEAALLADRKDALTKRPLDFDREEETRKGETMKWLESHFGSESTASNDSRDDDAEVEPTKKTYFNVTIKSATQAHNQATLTNGYKTAPVGDNKQTREQEPHTDTTKSKYYQGISNWAERKEKPATNHFASKAFRDDLQQTVERNRLKKNGAYTSRDKLNEGRYLVEPKDSYVSREDILQQKQKRQSLSSQFLAKSKQGSRSRLEDLNTPTVQRDATRYVAETLTDIRYGGTMQDEDTLAYPRMPVKPGNTADDLRPSPIGYTINHPRTQTNGREKSYERELNGVSYESSSHYDVKEIHASTPEIALMQGRPTVPQRRRAIEKKLRQQSTVSPSLKVPSTSLRDVTEPPPDYSPPPRSHSSSPQVDYNTSKHPSHPAATSSTLTRKQNQRTRFASTTTSPTYNSAQQQQRPLTATQTTQTTPSNISTSTGASHKSSKVGQMIGNSLRKLVNKIRSASAERKLRRKSRSKSREQSSSPQAVDNQRNSGTSATYQQYNVIDGHIGGQQHSNESEHESLPAEPVNAGKAKFTLYGHSATQERSNHQTFKRANSADPYENDRDVNHITSPRQRYYLGEDPYSSTLYGKENIYDPDSVAKRHRNARGALDANFAQGINREANQYKREEDGIYSNQKDISSYTLGRYQRGNQRVAGSTPNLSQDYRSVQTLPRKLNDHHVQSQSQYLKAAQRLPASGYSTLGQPERRTQYQAAPPAVNSGPAKPARTYAKVLNRSKSFNVHGMNGSNDHSPIYIEKLSRNSYANNLQSGHAYKSNPHLYSDFREGNSSLQSELKSPSIVNLISRSQRDLSKISGSEDERDLYVDRMAQSSHQLVQRDEKKQQFLKGLHQQAPDLYKTLHGAEDYRTQPITKYRLEPKRSLDSRSPIEVNKDTASIFRRGSAVNDDYGYDDVHNYTRPNRRVLMYADEPKRRGTGATVIELRNFDSRK